MTHEILDKLIEIKRLLKKDPENPKLRAALAEIEYDCNHKYTDGRSSVDGQTCKFCMRVI